ncbi:MAG: pyridoxal phosphate-dependent aminotransferase [Oscillospiraceae bacterium]|nr:pyridoxal phosphate-dependent aminotransferase [Oscillospiraceae bacterium]
MISDNMIRLAASNSAIRAMFEEGLRLAAEYGRENVFDFSLGNPNFPAPPEVNRALRDILEEEESTLVHGYMTNAGFPDVRDTVAASLNERFGGTFGKENIIMTAGAAGGLNIILKTLLNPGDEVIVFAPYFLEYGNYVNNYGGVIMPVHSAEPDFQPDAKLLKAAVTKKTKAVIINNPNNPTGVVYSENTIRSISEALDEKQKELGSPVYLISDEPYRELCYDGHSAVWLPNCFKNTIVCYSWSKSLSLPGERIGYLAIPPQAEDGARIAEAAAIAGRVLGFINAPSLMQRAAARCIRTSIDINCYDQNRKNLHGALTSLGFKTTYPAGAFYLWMKSPEPDEKVFVNKAKSLRLLLVPGSSFAGPGYVRIAYCVSPDMIPRSLPAFKELAGEYDLI